MSDKLKQLTGKNQKDFESAAYNLINIPDVALFEELVGKDDYLYDFIKQNVSKRLEKACNNKNYINLLQLMKFYSPSYEEFIIGQLVKYANEDLTDKMLELFENGNESEKTYCAKYFSYVKDSLALDYLRKYAYSDNQFLSTNSAEALSSFGEREMYNDAIKKLNSNDDYEQLAATKFLVSYGDKNAVSEIINAAKKSSLAEHIASELTYLVSLKEISEQFNSDGLYILNLIISGLGEVSALSQVFDFEMYDILENIISNEVNSLKAAVLLNAKDKFEILTENDEYLFDETKDTKQEIYDIKKLLEQVNKTKLAQMADEELKSDSMFVFTALEYTQNPQKVRNLLSCKNQTVVLKSVEILKKLRELTADDKNTALENITDENITNIILAI